MIQNNSYKKHGLPRNKTKTNSQKHVPSNLKKKLHNKNLGIALHNKVTITELPAPKFAAACTNCRRAADAEVDMSCIAFPLGKSVWFPLKQTALSWGNLSLYVVVESV